MLEKQTEYCILAPQQKVNKSFIKAFSLALKKQRFQYFKGFKALFAPELQKNAKHCELRGGKNASKTNEILHFGIPTREL